MNRFSLFTLAAGAAFLGACQSSPEPNASPETFNAAGIRLWNDSAFTVTHEQSELTGKHDETSQRKYRFENNQSDPRDFHFKPTSDTRYADCRALAAHMKSLNLDTTFFENIWTKNQDPWEKLKKNDINHFMHTFEIK
jgi:hypothetical protein